MQPIFRSSRIMLKNDEWIREQGDGLISPYRPYIVREDREGPVLSYGTGSYGYDLRLADNDFRIFRRTPGKVLDVKEFNPNHHLEKVDWHSDPRNEISRFFILPAHSYGLGVSLERVKMPKNVTGICIGKSTYARAGIIVNVTPIEAGWEGHITLEFSNSSDSDCRIYANEGVCQLLFLEGDRCETSYSDRKGKYQSQPRAVIPPRI
jgi:dCTP deaminase